jgi:hypothetical protein
VLRAIFIAACLVIASPSVAQQVRVTTGDIEHVYGPGGVLLDDADLQARNQRALENMQIEKQRALEKQQIEAERGLDQGAPLAYDTAPTWDSYGGEFSYGGGFFVGRHRIHPEDRRPSPRLGHFARMR